MNAGEIRLGAGVSGIRALGARSFEDFFRPVGASGFERATLLSSRRGVELVRYPLPGTPDAADAPDVSGGPGATDASGAPETPETPETIGRFRSGVPRGAGTGWLWLWRWTDARPAERWRARFTRPRSTSLAEREWNLACHLRAAGVGAPEPMAVGRGAGGVFARQSFVVLRALDGMRPLTTWLREPGDPRAEAKIARALGLALARLFDAGVVLPALLPENIWIAAPRSTSGGVSGEKGTCVARTIDSLRAVAHGQPVEPRLRWGKLPEVAFSDLAAGRIVGRVDLRARRAALIRIARGRLPRDPRIALRVLLGAIHGSQPNPRRGRRSGPEAEAGFVHDCSTASGLER